MGFVLAPSPFSFALLLVHLPYITVMNFRRILPVLIHPQSIFSTAGSQSSKNNSDIMPLVCLHPLRALHLLQNKSPVSDNILVIWSLSTLSPTFQPLFHLTPAALFFTVL